jgi:hypothetical protein
MLLFKAIKTMELQKTVNLSNSYHYNKNAYEISIKDNS